MEKKLTFGKKDRRFTPTRKKCETHVKHTRPTKKEFEPRGKNSTHEKKSFDP